MTRATNGPAVRALRDALGIQGRDFAARVGIHPGYLSKVENGRRQPTPAVVRRMADTLGVPLDAITYVIPSMDEGDAA